MTKYVAPIAIYNYASLRIFKKLYKIQTCQCSHFFQDLIVYTLIDRFLCYYKLGNTIHNVVVWTIILERWFFFYFKMIRSYINDDYRVRRLKYEKKYSIIYEKSTDKSTEKSEETID